MTEKIGKYDKTPAVSEVLKIFLINKLINCKMCGTLQPDLYEMIKSVTTFSDFEKTYLESGVVEQQAFDYVVNIPPFLCKKCYNENSNNAPEVQSKGEGLQIPQLESFLFTQKNKDTPMSESDKEEYIPPTVGFDQDTNDDVEWISKRKTEKQPETDKRCECVTCHRSDELGYSNPSKCKNLSVKTLEYGKCKIEVCLECHKACFFYKQYQDDFDNTQPLENEVVFYRDLKTIKNIYD